MLTKLFIEKSLIMPTATLLDNIIRIDFPAIRKLTIRINVFLFTYSESVIREMPLTALKVKCLVHFL